MKGKRFTGEQPIAGQKEAAAGAKLLEVCGRQTHKKQKLLRTAPLGRMRSFSSQGWLGSVVCP